MEHQQIIKLWPTVGTLAQDLNRPRRTVENWAYRKSIPSDVWKDMIEAARERRLKVKLEDFVHATENLKRPRPKPKRAP